MKNSVLTVLLLSVVTAVSAAEGEKMRNAHYIASTHWDREWYEPFQGYRMRLVSLLDEVFATFDKDPAFKSFTTDGQTIPLYDYLEIRPEKRALVQSRIAEGRLATGPWYVQSDEWLVSGESLIRNLELGRSLAAELGAPATRAGFLCDQFGHIGQMPQILAQMGIKLAFVWRGVPAGPETGHFNWQAPDGTVLPAYRFGKNGYCTYCFAVRSAIQEEPFALESAVGRLVEYTLEEAKRSPAGPLLLFDGGDHLEIEPRTSELIARANKILEPQGLRIIHSDPDRYLEELLAGHGKIETTVKGELRESRRDKTYGHLIPGVLSSRIHLKQRNALCEDELCQWAEPFSAFAAASLGTEYPSSYLRAAWLHLLHNHPHDSMCGCSIDQVHQDMLYRFDQSFGISSRLAGAALKNIALAAAPADLPAGAITVIVFNPTAAKLDEPVDLEIPLPEDWPTFKEFFGYEEKFAFRLTGPRGEDIPCQLTGQVRDSHGFSRERYHFPRGEVHHLIQVSAPLSVPAFGYTTLIVQPADSPTRHSGSLAVSPRALENEFLRVWVEPDGTLSLTDKRTGKKFEQLLTFEDRADIGDGWYHGVAVNDRTFISTGCGAQVALAADGFAKATLQVDLEMKLPEAFDFKKMRRSERTAPLKITSRITLRKGSDRLEVETTVENNIRDHRLRVLLPTGLAGETYLSNSAFDVVERKVALAADNDSRDELEVETRPQFTWTAFGDGRCGLAVVSRGLPESAVTDTPERTIALTLLRAFRRAVFSDDNPGGQVQGSHTFRYDIVPFAAEAPVSHLYLLGQRVNGAVRLAALSPRDLKGPIPEAKLPAEHSFLETGGRAVFSSIRRDNGRTLLRFFNPYPTREKLTLRPAVKPGTAQCVTLDGRADPLTSAVLHDGVIEVSLPPKRIATLALE